MENDQRKKISVIIPAFNSARFIDTAIDSVVCQKINNLEIIVIDDGSTDTTATVIKKYVDLGLVRYVYQVNSGPGAARNRGLDSVDGEYVCFLDADDTLLPGSIAKRLDFMQRHPEVGMVFTDLYRCRSKGDDTEVHLRDNGFLKKFEPAIVKSQPPEYILNARYVPLAFEHNPFIKTPTVMLRKSIIENVGGFDRSLCAAEDIDLWLRIARKFPIGYIDEPLTCWNNYQSTLTADTNRFFKDTIIFYENQLNSPETTIFEKKMLRHRLGRLFFDYGYHEIKLGHKFDARRYFLRSLGYRPFETKAWKNILLSTLPGSFLTFLRELKNKMVRHG